MEPFAGYEILETIGRGAIATCSLARPPERADLAHPLCVLKVWERTFSGEVDLELAKERLAVARAVRQQAGTGMVELYEAGMHDGQVFLSMSYGTGGSLANPKSYLDNRSRVAAVADAARAAHDLHEVGEVHGAIKPTNVLFGEGGGLAEPALGSPGDGVGASDPYLDPEVDWAEEPSRSIDIWALGITLHAALTREAPTRSADGEGGAALPALDSSLGGQIRLVIEHCLAPRRADRFGTALDLAEAIEQSAEEL